MDGERDPYAVGFVGSPNSVQTRLTASDPQFYDKKRATEAELGRELSTAEFAEKFYKPDADGGAGTSIFDPVLCELAYRWFCPPGGRVLDPFAGGSVRGIVAATLGLQYLGFDLSERQIAANREQALAIGCDPMPQWIAGDAREMEEQALRPDLIFSCPPYADLERYSDDPRDLSTMAWPDFCSAYREIIRRAVSWLAPDRFACFVVGEVRGPDGFYRGLVPETIAAFEAAGAGFYNEAILITAIGSLPIRAGKVFAAARKLGKTHQNLLCFVKGDPKAATAACGEVIAGRDFEILEAAPLGGEVLS